ncbi:MAG TPA: MBL fold metallo-hydrolase [Pseudonocardia sp.]|nr:MBL fold metallo-hydrolase [Pseudonocardia sp.]
MPRETPTELAPGVLRIPTGPGNNAFLVDGDDGLILVDVGWLGAPARIEAAVTEFGRAITDIRRVVITHAHPDHVRGAAELRARSGAQVLIHRADAEWLRTGRVPPEGRSGRLGRLVDRVPLLHWRPLEPDGALADGDYVGDSSGLRVIHTPGHTPGHIALLHEPTETVLVGDAIFSRGGTLSLGPAALAADPLARPAGLARLPRAVKAVGLAHGDALVDDDLERYAALLPT